jgi:hypothetical protein
MYMYASCSVASSVCTWEVMVQGTYIFKKMVFKKRNSTMLWEKMQLRGPKAMYACVEKFRAITSGIFHSDNVTMVSSVI